MKVRIKHRPTGYLSLDGGPLTEWPPAGTVVELPEGVAQPMVDAGNAEVVRTAAKPTPVVETRPAPTEQTEIRKPGPGRPRKPE